MAGWRATEDKPEVANRVAYAGVGINLRTSRPKPAKVAAAVSRIHSEPDFRRRAHNRDRAGRPDAPAECADLLEQLIATGPPGQRSS